MRTDVFKAALRAACDNNIAALRKLLTDFQQHMQGLEASAKANPENDPEMISLVIEAELKRYAKILDEL